MSDYLGKDNSLEKCLQAIYEIQFQKQTDRNWQRYNRIRQKENAAKKILEQLYIPKLTGAEKMSARFYQEKVFWWNEEDEGYFETVGYCSKCHEYLYDGEGEGCCYCGSFGSTKLRSKREFDFYGDVVKLCTQGDIVYAVVYRVEKQITFVKKGKYLKNGFVADVEYTSYPRDVFVLNGEMPFQMSAWYATSMYGTKEFNHGTEWYYKTSECWPWGAKMLPYEEEILYTTPLAHSHVKEFEEFMVRYGATGAHIIKYLRLFAKYPAVENLVTNNFSNWVSNISISGNSGQSLNLNAKKLKDITGLNRDEQKRAKAENWSLSMLKIYKEYRDKKHIFLARDVLETLVQMDINRVKRYSTDKLAIALYLVKKKKTVQYWLDYMDMAKKLEYDIGTKDIQMPCDLVKAHDKAAEKVEFIENEKLIKTFAELSQQLAPLNYSKDDLSIVVPKRERELILEGKILQHCVGGYGRAHCEGRSIFFVRKAADKTTPYYTLQVDLKRGLRLQLHGYKNDAKTPIPKEVYDFVDYWLKNVFRRFDVQTMKFIDKPKAAATA